MTNKEEEILKEEKENYILQECGKPVTDYLQGFIDGQNSKDEEWKVKVEKETDKIIEQVKVHLEQFGKGKNRDIDTRDKFIMQMLPIIIKKNLFEENQTPLSTTTQCEEKREGTSSVENNQICECGHNYYEHLWHWNYEGKKVLSICIDINCECKKFKPKKAEEKKKEMGK